MHLVEDHQISSNDTEHTTHDHGHKKKCICGDDKCSGSCMTNCQCTFQEMTLKETVVIDLEPDLSGQFICPMRCEGRKTYPKPGDCPVCGMHMEKVVVFGKPQSETKSEDTKAYKKMLFRLILAAVFTIPIVILSMGELIPSVEQVIESLFRKKVNLLIQLGLSVPVVLFAAGFIFKKGFFSIVTRNLNMFTLISVGAGIAWVYSIVAALFPEIFPEGFRGSHGYVAVYFEAAAVILTLVILGQMLELRAHAKTNNAIKELLNLVPATALVLRNGREIEVSL